MTFKLRTSHDSTRICLIYIYATHLSNNQARVQAGPQVVDKAQSASQPVTFHPGRWVRHRDGPDGAAEYDALSARPGGFKFTRWRESASHRHGDTGSQVPISLRRRAGPCRARGTDEAALSARQIQVYRRMMSAAGHSVRFGPGCRRQLEFLFLELANRNRQPGVQICHDAHSLVCKTCMLHVSAHVFVCIVGWLQID